jgi:hypothetical protein
MLYEIIPIPINIRNVMVPNNTDVSILRCSVFQIKPRITVRLIVLRRMVLKGKSTPWAMLIPMTKNRVSFIIVKFSNFMIMSY